MGLIRRLRVAQGTMERDMLGVSLLDLIRNLEIRRRRTRVTDITQRVAKLKWKFPVRSKDGRWGPMVLEWQPCPGNRSFGRPRGGRTTLSASQVDAGSKRHITEDFVTSCRRPMSSSGCVSVDMMMMINLTLARIKKHLYSIF
ncbi:jg16945 [Pararge aegeria aegeria]|uniref:Jg16945 protein n=1 Tax=Pararge aegeria aegeria TaxID=348720 RepID=A0A8S4SAD0_9NEOP|nr:jg16945 [Pararge aegeria aegeria]